MDKFQDIEILILTGMSGSGKSRALNALEDIGYYCIDNLPPRFLLPFAEFLVKESSNINRIAVMIDVRSNDLFSELLNVIKQIKHRSMNVKTLFMDCNDSVLITRYKETRRNHPLMGNGELSLPEAIIAERKMLNEIKASCDFIIDTSWLSTSALRERVVDLFAQNTNDGMIINFVSFGFKHGSLLDADLVFDVRCLKNPYYVPELKTLTGMDEAVRDFVMGHEEAQKLYELICNYLEYTLPLYKKEGKSQLVVGLGCTGGKHRSITFAILLAEHFKNHEYRVITNHRDIHKA